MFKKLLISFSLLMFLFGLSSCGNDVATETETPELENLPTQAPNVDGPGVNN